MRQMTTTPVRRRRRSPEEAEREIIAAAEAFLRERPFRELTVDEVMRRTGLSRPAFYVYFSDRHRLVIRMVERVQAELFEVANRWYKGTGDGETLVREAIAGVVCVYSRHGQVLRALSDAAADDEGVEAVYGSLVETFVRATAEHIEREIAAGAIEGIEAHPTAVALTHLMERYLNSMLGHGEATFPPEVLTETLATIWNRTLYRA